MIVKVSRNQMIATTINNWLESGTIRDEGDKVERAVLELSEYDTESLLHIMLEAHMNRPANMDLLGEVEPAFNFSPN
jgi:hypothetical protein